MPTLFDSHEEFNEWFSKDIENHAENKSAIDESKFNFGVSILYRSGVIYFDLITFYTFRASF